MKKTPRIPRSRLVDGFRLVYAFTPEHNCQRLRRFVERVGKADRRTQSGRLFAIKQRRRSRGAQA